MSPAMITLSRAIWFAVVGLALTGCTVGPNFEKPKPEVPVGWSAASSPGVPSHADPATAAEAAWWTSFGDPELTALIGRAAAANLDLKEAGLRIAEARAQRDAAAAQELPSLNGNASFTGTQFSTTTTQGRLFNQFDKISGAVPAPGLSFPNPYGQYQLGFDASWELDLFGHVRRGVEAAGAQVEAAAWDQRGAQVSLFGEVARAYVDLRRTQTERVVTVATISTLKDLLDLARQRRQAGLSNDIDVSRAVAQVTSAQASLPQLDRQMLADMNQLSHLLGLPPGALIRELASAQRPPAVPPVVPVGLPSDLARRRPDIQGAEARLHAAVAQQGVAIAELYPKVTLTASGGTQSDSLTHLLDWASRFGTVGPQVQVPIFDAGRRKANVRLQDARAREAAVDYAKTVLGALHEVDDALNAYNSEQVRRGALAATVEQNNAAMDLATDRYKSGVGDYLAVLDAERTLEQNQLQLAESDAAVSTDLVALYKALGGGWDAAPAAKTGS
jgi:NodT family efflux transporter outer membrane factor (OMF) lipoprotein